MEVTEYELVAQPKLICIAFFGVVEARAMEKLHCNRFPCFGSAKVGEPPIGLSLPGRSEKVERSEWRAACPRVDTWASSRSSSRLLCIAFGLNFGRSGGDYSMVL